MKLILSRHMNLKNGSNDLNGVGRRNTLEKRRKIACPEASRAFQSSKIISQCIKNTPK